MPEMAIETEEHTGSSQLGADVTADGKPRAAVSEDSGNSPSGDDPEVSRIGQHMIS